MNYFSLILLSSKTPKWNRIIYIQATAGSIKWYFRRGEGVYAWKWMKSGQKGFSYSLTADWMLNPMECLRKIISKWINWAGLLDMYVNDWWWIYGMHGKSLSLGCSGIWIDRRYVYICMVFFGVKVWWSFDIIDGYGMTFFKLVAVKVCLIGVLYL